MPRLLESQWEEIKEVFEEEDWSNRSGLKENFHKRVKELFPHLEISPNGLYKKASVWKQKIFIRKEIQSGQKSGQTERK